MHSLVHTPVSVRCTQVWPQLVIVITPSTSHAVVVYVAHMDMRLNHE